MPDSSGFQCSGLPLRIADDPPRFPFTLSHFGTYERLWDLLNVSASRAAKVYRWIEFANKGEQITEFDESHFQLEGHFESNSSEGHKATWQALALVGTWPADAVLGLLGPTVGFGHGEIDSVGTHRYQTASSVHTIRLVGSPSGLVPLILESLFPLSRVPFWAPTFDPHPYESGRIANSPLVTHEVFQDRLRAIHFRKEGKTKARSETQRCYTPHYAEMNMCHFPLLVLNLSLLDKCYLFPRALKQVDGKDPI